MTNLDSGKRITELRQHDRAVQIIEHLIVNSPITREDLEDWLEPALEGLIVLASQISAAANHPSEEELTKIDLSALYSLPSILRFQGSTERSIIQIVTQAFQFSALSLEARNERNAYRKEDLYRSAVALRRQISELLIEVPAESPINNPSAAIAYIYLIYFLNECVIPSCLGRSFDERVRYEALMDIRDWLVIAKQTKLIKVDAGYIGKEPELEYVKTTPEGIERDLKNIKVGDFLHFSIDSTAPQHAKIVEVFHRLGLPNLQIHGVVFKLEEADGALTHVHVISPWLNQIFAVARMAPEETFGPYGLRLPVESFNQLFREDSADFLADFPVSGLEVDAEYDSWQLLHKSYVRIPVILKGVVGPWALVAPLGEFADDLPPVIFPFICQLLHKGIGNDGELVLD